MKRSTAALAALIVPSTLLAAPAAAETAPGGVTMEIVAINGTGCPAGTAAVAVSDDGGEFRITLAGRGMHAEAGGNAPPTAFRANCQIKLKVHAPEKQTYAIDRIDYSGTAHLESGASATLKSMYFFPNMSAPVRSHTLRGPFSGAWRFFDDDAFEPVFKGCGEERTLNLSTELRIDLGDSDRAKTNVIEVSQPADTVYRFRWKTCP